MPKGGVFLIKRNRFIKKQYYICRHCGSVMERVSDAGVKPVCCAQKMEELIPNTVEASGEKHIPAVSVSDGVVSVSDGVVSVNVGSVDHPMVDAHYIEWVYVKTEKGGRRKYLNPGDAPNVTFRLDDDKAVAVYAYCNLHGLWVTEL